MTTFTMLPRSFPQHPHEVFDRLRELGPLIRTKFRGGIPCWLVSRYDEAQTLLSDSRLRKDFAHVATLIPTRDAGTRDVLNAHMLQSDPPVHTRLRKLVGKAFTSGVVERAQPYIEAIADELLDAIDDDAPFDLMESFVLPLSMRTIGELLAVPADDWEEFKSVMEQSLGKVIPENQGAVAEAQADVLARLIVDKRRNSGTDLLSALSEVTDDGEGLSEHELLSTVYLLAMVGCGKTANVIGNGVLALLDNPAQLALLRSKPSLITNTVEELLRFDGPVVVATLRFTTATIRVGRMEIPENELVLISPMGANRDPVQFERPDQLDITREHNSHLAFGHGIHYCLGAPLARMQTRIALDRLLTRFSRISREHPTTPPVYRDSTLLRGLTSLPVRGSRQ